jgi:hypothetical protein
VAILETRTHHEGQAVAGEVSQRCPVPAHRKQGDTPSTMQRLVHQQRDKQPWVTGRTRCLNVRRDCWVCLIASCLQWRLAWKGGRAQTTGGRSVWPAVMSWRG